MSRQSDPEARVREIRRETRRRYSCEEKIRIVLEALQGEESVAELCRGEGISPNLSYTWSKEFLEAGQRRLQGDIEREATRGEGVSLRQENGPLKHRVADLSLRRTLEELQVPRSTLYRWCRAYEEEGYAGLGDQQPERRRFWNRIPEAERERGVETALARPELSPRELAWQITDTEGSFISESSVYRILKAFDRVASPASVVLTAKDRLDPPTRRGHELWQTDFTYFKVVGWGWYDLLTVLDDYSR